MSHTYLTTQELSELIKYNPRTIRNELKDSVLIEGIHYIRPFGGRKILYVWEEIEKDMRTGITGSINAMALQEGELSWLVLGHVRVAIWSTFAI